MREMSKAGGSRARREGAPVEWKLRAGARMLAAQRETYRINRLHVCPRAHTRTLCVTSPSHTHTCAGAHAHAQASAHAHAMGHGRHAHSSAVRIAARSSASTCAISLIGCVRAQSPSGAPAGACMQPASHGAASASLLSTLPACTERAVRASAIYMHDCTNARSRRDSAVDAKVTLSRTAPIRVWFGSLRSGTGQAVPRTWRRCG